MSDLVIWVVAVLLFLGTGVRWLLLPLSVSWAAWAGFCIGASIGAYLSRGTMPILLASGFALAAVVHFANGYRLAIRYGLTGRPVKNSEDRAAINAFRAGGGFDVQSAVTRQQVSSKPERPRLREDDRARGARVENGGSLQRPHRSVLVVVPRWPGGTMAIKFGRAMEDALGVKEGQLQLVQMSPERIFRAMTNVTEHEFRASLSESGTSVPDAISFVEDPAPMDASPGLAVDGPSPQSLPSFVHATRLSKPLPERRSGARDAHRQLLLSTGQVTEDPMPAVPLHGISNEVPSDAFAECWRAAGYHLDGMVQDGIQNWLKGDLGPPFLEHLSFRLGNQLFFVRIEEATGQIQVPGTRSGLMKVADGCRGWACLMPMRRARDGMWRPDAPGWGLLDATSGLPIDPVALVSEEKIEMTDWELQQFGVQVVRQQLEGQGLNVTACQSTPGVDPSIWIDGNAGPEWVVVRTVRYPEKRARVPTHLQSIVERCRGISAAGYFASVSAARADSTFAAGDPSPGRLLRGHGLYARYPGLEKVTEDAPSAADKPVH